MKFKVKQLHKHSKIPSYANPGDAGMDLYAVGRYSLKAGQIGLVATGIACQLPKGSVGLIWDKSSISTQKGLKVMGGVIDEGYRGEVMVGLINLSNKTHVIETGDKVAQILIQKVHRVSPVKVDSLGGSVRSVKGFGSSGSK